MLVSSLLEFHPGVTHSFSRRLSPSRRRRRALSLPRRADTRRALFAGRLAPARRRGSLCRICWAPVAVRPQRVSWHDRVDRACPRALTRLHADRARRFFPRARRQGPADRLLPRADLPRGFGSCSSRLLRWDVASTPMTMPERRAMGLTETSQNPNSDLLFWGFLHGTVALTATCPLGKCPALSIRGLCP